MLGEMVENGCESNVHTYTMPITVLCDARKFQEVFDLVDKMAERGCQPKFYNYTTLISGLCKEACWKRQVNYLIKYWNKA